MSKNKTQKLNRNTHRERGGRRRPYLRYMRATTNVEKTIKAEKLEGFDTGGQPHNRLRPRSAPPGGRNSIAKNEHPAKTRQHQGCRSSRRGDRRLGETRRGVGVASTEIWNPRGVLPIARKKERLVRRRPLSAGGAGGWRGNDGGGREVDGRKGGGDARGGGGCAILQFRLNEVRGKRGVNICLGVPG